MWLVRIRILKEVFLSQMDHLVLYIISCLLYSIHIDQQISQKAYIKRKNTLTRHLNKGLHIWKPEILCDLGFELAGYHFCKNDTLTVYLRYHFVLRLFCFRHLKPCHFIIKYKVNENGRKVICRLEHWRPNKPNWPRRSHVLHLCKNARCKISHRPLDKSAQ